MRTRQLFKGLGALSLTTALVVGLPAVLVANVSWPLPTRLPTIDEIGLALRSGIDPALLIKTLAVIVWIAWAQLVVAVTAETIASVRGRVARRVPVLPGLQTAAARLVATIALVATSIGPLRPQPALGTPLAVLIAEPTHHSLVVEPLAHTDTQSSPDRLDSKPSSDGLAAYRVGRFDTLWKLAETTLGDGRRWQEIRDLNLGRAASDGRLITSATEHVPPDSMLLLPGDATHHPPPAEDHTHTDELTNEVVVESGDSFWSIAEDALEDAWGRQPTSSEITPYWRQLIEANRHRLRPPYDPDLIFPGQTFELPAIPSGAIADPGPPDPSVTDTIRTDEVAVERGDHFWSIAADALANAWGRQPTSAEITPYWRQLIEANRHRLRPPYDPDLIFPGQTFELPAIPDDPTAPAPTTEPHSETPPLPTEDQQTTGDASADPEPDVPIPETPIATPPDTAPLPPISTLPSRTPSDTPDGSRTETEPPGHAADEDEDGGSLLPIATTLAGLGVLAAGVVALINRLRRTQLRLRRPGTTPTPAPATATPTEATLRAAAAPTATELIDLALRALAHQINANHTPSPQVVGVHLDPEILRVLLWAPHHDPPPGWQADDDGRSWKLPANTDPTQLRLLGDGTPAPYPTMVTVGHCHDTQLLLDLEYLGAVQVTGDPGEVAATCYTMATELAASPLADTLQVVCIGFGSDLAHLERIRVVDQLADILDAVDDKVAAVGPETETTPLQGRLAPAGGDFWEPIVILDPTPHPPEGASRLLAAALSGRTVCAVVGYPTGDQWRLHVSDGTIRIDPLGYSYDRRNLTPTEQASIADLVIAAKDLEGLPDTQPVAAYTSDTEPLDPATDSAHFDTMPATLDAESEIEPTTTLEIRVLGTLRVEGLTERFPQRKCPELVTYLALHRHGVEADTLMEALWPEQPPEYRRLNILTSRARTTLGKAPDGGLYVPHIRGGIYLVSPQLGCDLERFDRLVRAADRASPPADAVEHLRAALELVEGPPFNGVGDAYNWAHTEGIITHAIVAIDNAAHRLAQDALTTEDPALASWAARKGLTATSACEECYRNLMRAAIAQDDQTALEATFSELVAVVDADEGPDAISFLDPATIELYEQATRRRRREAG